MLYRAPAEGTEGVTACRTDSFTGCVCVCVCVCARLHVSLPITDQKVTKGSPGSDLGGKNMVRGSGLGRKIIPSNII